MSILAWAAVILAVWLVVGFLIGTRVGRFIAKADSPLKSSPDAAAQADARRRRLVGEEYPDAALQQQRALGIGHGYLPHALRTITVWAVLPPFLVKRPVYLPPGSTIPPRVA
jgi:hypothetical protein